MEITIQKAVEIIENGGRVIVENFGVRLIADSNSMLQLSFINNATFFTYEY